MNENELLPCPFCGSDAEIERMGNNRVSMIIACCDCGCKLESSETFLNKHSRWNTRTALTAEQWKPIETAPLAAQSDGNGE